MAVLKFRPFRIRNVIDSKFLTVDSKDNEKWCLEDLAKSGLEPEDLAAAYPSNLKIPKGSTAAYNIPYYDLNGEVIRDANNVNVMWRTRCRLPEFSKQSRYTQPSGEELNGDGLPPFLPYLYPYGSTWDITDEGIIYCTEGEKKTAAFAKYLRLPVFGIGGCHMWRNPAGTGGLHPWIGDYLQAKKIQKVIVIPDADVFRYDMSQTYGTFIKVLEEAGYEAELLNPPAKIDDFIIANRFSLNDAFKGIPHVSRNDLVQTPASLIEKYGLAFKTDAKGIRHVHQHTSNIMRLLEDHSAFPRIWRNQDNNRVMVGEDAAQPDFTEMQIANYFQHNFGFEKVGHKTLYSCIQAMAKKNAQSPMLDYIRSRIWDGVQRIDTWLTSLWGVSDSPYTREVGSKWLVGACARMAEPGCKIDWMLIVVGPQRTGKTSMPDVLFNGAALTLYGEHNDKDLHMLLHSALCIGFDELDSFGKREASNLKAMITRKEDAFRPPYGASVELFPRRFTLYGCGNRYEFLQHDPTGYRRYAVVEVNQLLDFKRLEAERDQLWAEAWLRYSAGGEYIEIASASSEAEKFVIPNIMEEKIAATIEKEIKSKIVDHIVDGYLVFTMAQLLSWMGDDNSARNTNVTREIAAILRSMGAEQRVVRINSKTTSRRYYLQIQS